MIPLSARNARKLLVPQSIRIKILSPAAGILIASSRMRDPMLGLRPGVAMKLVQAVAVLVGLGAGGAQAAGALWHRSATLDYQVAADGTSTATEIWEVRADTNAVAHTIAQQTFSYIADLDAVEL